MCTIHNGTYASQPEETTQIRLKMWMLFNWFLQVYTAGCFLPDGVKQCMPACLVIHAMLQGVCAQTSEFIWQRTSLISGVPNQFSAAFSVARFKSQELPHRSLSFDHACMTYHLKVAFHKQVDPYPQNRKLCAVSGPIWTTHPPCKLGNSLLEKTRISSSDKWRQMPLKTKKGQYSILISANDTFCLISSERGKRW